MQVSFSGQQAGENLLLVIYKSHLFWIKKSLSFWLTLNVFGCIGFFFLSFILESLNLVILLFMIFQLFLLFYCSFRFSQKRKKNSLIVTNQRLIKTSKSHEASLQLEEIVDVVINDKKSWLGATLTFNGGSKVDMSQVKNAKEIANYIQKVARMRATGENKLIPKFN